MSTDRPALLGNQPAFAEFIPLVRPTLPPFQGAIERGMADIFASGMLTKGKHLRRFEALLGEHLGVRHAVAVSSCTLGLMLAYQALELEGEIIVPSFTFMATVHPLLWLKLTPVFVDVDAQTWNIDPRRVEAAITPKTSTIVAVHNFGNPAPIEPLQALARKHDLRLVFDAAHGFGSLYRGRPLGAAGDAQVFSLSPTKLLVAGEGGVVATNDPAIAEHARVGREYGNPGDYGSRFPGLNARMPEFSALLGIHSLQQLEANVQNRNRVVDAYRQGLADVPGIRLQSVHAEDRCSYKDLSILIDEEQFGLSRDQLCLALKAENIDTRKYHDPPVHQQAAYTAYRRINPQPLPVTDRLARRSLSLPIWSHLPMGVVDGICECIGRIHLHAEAIERSLASTGAKAPPSTSSQT